MSCRRRQKRVFGLRRRRALKWREPPPPHLVLLLRRRSSPSCLCCTYLVFPHPPSPWVFSLFAPLPGFVVHTVCPRSVYCIVIMSSSPFGLACLLCGRPVLCHLGSAAHTGTSMVWPGPPRPDHALGHALPTYGRSGHTPSSTHSFSTPQARNVSSQNKLNATDILVNKPSNGASHR